MLIILCLLGLAAAAFLIRMFNDGSGGVDLGLVSFAVGDRVVEMKMVVFIIMVVVAFVVLYFLLRLLGWLVRIPKRARQRRENKKQRRVAEDMERGYMQYLSGRSGSAQRLLDKGVNSNMPVLASLTAAQAANQVGDSNKREHFIECAIEKAPEHKDAIQLERARMLVHAEDWPNATECLKDLRKLMPSNPEVVRMLVKSLRAEDKGEELYEMVPTMRRMNAAPVAEIDAIESDTAIKRMQSIEQKPELSMFWNNMNKRLKNNEVVAGEYAQRLMDFDDADTAEEILRASIRRKFNADNVRRYGLCAGTNATKMLSQAEKWAKRNKDSGIAHLTAGRLAVKNGLTAKAREYFERAEQLAAGPEAAKELGILLEGEGDTQAALAHYRNGLDNVVSVSALPAPDAETIDGDAESAGSQERTEDASEKIT